MRLAAFYRKLWIGCSESGFKISTPGQGNASLFVEVSPAKQ